MIARNAKALLLAKHAANRLFGMLQNKSAKIKPHFAG